jgi:hypothetical protein
MPTHGDAGGPAIPGKIMHRLRTICRRAWLLAIAALCWLGTDVTALAARGLHTQEEDKSSGGGGGYVASYAIVLLFIVLGLMVILNPSRRRDRPRPEKYGE